MTQLNESENNDQVVKEETVDLSAFVEEVTTEGMSKDAMNDHIKGVIESILFVNEKPVTLEQFKRLFKTVSIPELRKAISELQDSYTVRQSGINILEIAGGYQILTNRAYAGYIRDFYKTRHKEKLSKPSLECLAIIAYKQPVTRGDIELIRGVNSDGIFNTLLDKELIKIVGKKEVQGAPYLYGTTRQFMEYFGLRSLEDLPKLEEFIKLQPNYETDVENPDAIPVSMNSLERMKQGAISDAKQTETFLPKQEILSQPNEESASSDEVTEPTEEQA